MLIQKIKQDLISHIKSGDKIKISITRLLIAALKDKEISLRNPHWLAVAFLFFVQPINFAPKLMSEVSLAPTRYMSTWRWL